jgi:hypothetical protein
MVIIKKTNAGEDVGKEEIETLLVGMKICTTTMEISMDGPQETKARATI